MNGPSVHRFDPASEFATSERCFIVEVSNGEHDPEVSIARARVSPGVATRWHRLAGTAERYVILEGTGRVEVGDVVREVVKAGDVVLIPPGCAQRIANIGESDLVFLAICTPRFRAEVYSDAEAT